VSLHEQGTYAPDRIYRWTTWRFDGAGGAHEAGEGGYHDLATLFGIGYRRLQRWVAQFRATESIGRYREAEFGARRLKSSCSTRSSVSRAHDRDGTLRTIR
jgi:hypothetical protein